MGRGAGAVMGLRQALRIPARSARDMIRRAAGYPVKNQPLWIDPTGIADQINSKNPLLQRLMLGESCDGIPEADLPARVPAALRNSRDPVLSHDFDLCVTPITNHPTLQRMERKLGLGLSWEEAGFHDWMMQMIARTGGHDGCSSLEDVVARYARLDRIVAEVRQTGRLAIRPGAGDRDGIAVMVGRRGQIIFANAGTHRLAIARHFRVPCEANVCVVHAEAVASGAWRERVRASQELGATLAAPKPH